jgi:hypothetical protein
MTFYDSYFHLFCGAFQAFNRKGDARLRMRPFKPVFGEHTRL